MMKLFIRPLYKILIVFFSIHVQAEAANIEIIHKEIQCGDFTAFADTERVTSADGFSRTTKQSIKIKDKESRSLHVLNLSQHRSRDPDAGGMLEVDAPAYIWSCLISPSSKAFLYVDAGCENQSATTCTLSGSMSNERQQVYDSKGRTLLKDVNGVSKAEERKLRALGIWNAFSRSLDVTPENYLM